MLAQLSSRYQTLIYLILETVFMERARKTLHIGIYFTSDKIEGRWSVALLVKLVVSFVRARIYLARFIIIPA